MNSLESQYITLFNDVVNVIKYKEPGEYQIPNTRRILPTRYGQVVEYPNLVLHIAQIGPDYDEPYITLVTNDGTKYDQNVYALQDFYVEDLLYMAKYLNEDYARGCIFNLALVLSHIDVRLSKSYCYYIPGLVLHDYKFIVHDLNGPHEDDCKDYDCAGEFETVAKILNESGPNDLYVELWDTETNTSFHIAIWKDPDDGLTFTENISNKKEYKKLIKEYIL